MSRTTRRPRNVRALLAALWCLTGVSVHAEEPLDCVIEPHLLVDVSSSEVGVVGAVRVDEADVVREGNIIAELRTGVERAALALTRARAEDMAEIELLRHDYQFNTRSRERSDELFSRRVVSAHSLDEVRTAEKLAGLRLQAATESRHRTRLEVTRDELALARRIVRSPINGVVVERYKTAGEYVEGDPIVQLAQLDPLRVELVAPISMLGSFAVNMQATVIPEVPMDGHFIASVTSIDPIVDAATATFGVRLSLPNPDRRLPPGLNCTLVLHPETERLAAVEGAPDRAESAGVTEPEAAAAPTSSSGHAVPEPGRDPARAPTPVKPLVVASMPVPDAAAPSDRRPQSGLCATLGPMESDREADEIATTLTASDIWFQRRHAGGADSDGWMVVSRDVHRAPAQVIERLERAGIADFQRLFRGKWKNRISYGTYRVRRWAQRRLESMQALGFDVELRRVNLGKSNVWLDLLGSPFGRQLPSAVTTVLDGNPTLTVQSIPCTRLTSK